MNYWDACVRMINLILVMKTIDFYGCKIGFECPDDPSFELDCLRPFRFFLTEANPAKKATIRLEGCHFDDFPSLPAKFTTPRNAVFEDGRKKIIDYGGKAVVIESSPDSFEIVGEDRQLIQEICYSLVLSLMGQHCDETRLLRIHGMTVALDQAAAVIMTPSGGGKSTLLFELLKSPGVRIVAEDITIVNRHGTILPNPMPVGTENFSQIAGIPEQYLWKQHRIEFGQKYRVDLEYWGDKVAAPCPTAKIFFCTERLLSGDPKITSISKFEALRFLMRDAVIGIGVYQGLEFLLTRSIWDALKRIPYFIKRLIIALRLSFQAPFFRFSLSRDTRRNVDYLKTWVAEFSQKQKSVSGRAEILLD